MAGLIMGGLFSLFYPWGAILQIAAIVHFIRRRPDGYWLWVIFIGGPLGAAVYLVVEALPDVTLLRGSFRGFGRRKRIRELETAILDNPSAGNYEELADLYLEEQKYARARECYDRAISTRTDHPDPFYRRALAAMALGDYAAAVPDLERTVQMDRKYDYHRALGLLAHALARTGQSERAARTFEDVLQVSTASETQVNYAELLAVQGRRDEARQVAQKVLAKKATMPGYLKRRERPWFRRAAGLLKQV